MRKTEVGHLLPIALCAALVAWSLLYPSLPTIVRILVRFPGLESATYLEGTYEFEGVGRDQRSFISNPQGRFEFHCGPLGARTPCLVSPERYQGRPAKVWYSFWYGSIQYELTQAPGARHHPLDVSSYRYADAAAYSRKIQGRPVNFWFIFLAGASMIWFIVKEAWRRNQLKNSGESGGETHG